MGKALPHLTDEQVLEALDPAILDKLREATRSPALSHLTDADREAFTLYIARLMIKSVRDRAAGLKVQ